MASGQNIEVTENGRTQILIVPPMKDKLHQDAIIQEEIQKTREELRKKPPKEKSKLSKKEIGGQLKEFNDWRKKKERGTGNRKYW
jgi:hypothetical protein